MTHCIAQAFFASRNNDCASRDHIPASSATCEINLTRGFVAIIDECDLALVSQRKWKATTSNGHTYAVCRIGTNTGVRMHRLIMGAKRGQVVDHESNDGLDNRRTNLRIATYADNSHNMRSSANQKRGGFKGVTWCARTSKWRATIRVPQPAGPSRRAHLGRFTHPEEAALAYDAAARLHYGRFAACNFPVPTGRRS